MERHTPTPPSSSSNLSKIRNLAEEPCRDRSRRHRNGSPGRSTEHSRAPQRSAEPLRIVRLRGRSEEREGRSAETSRSRPRKVCRDEPDDMSSAHRRNRSRSPQRRWLSISPSMRRELRERNGNHTRARLSSPKREAKRRRTSGSPSMDRRRYLSDKNSARRSASLLSQGRGGSPRADHSDRAQKSSVRSAHLRLSRTPSIVSGANRRSRIADVQGKPSEGRARKDHRADSIAATKKLNSHQSSKSAAARLRPSSPSLSQESNGANNTLRQQESRLPQTHSCSSRAESCSSSSSGDIKLRKRAEEGGNLHRSNPTASSAGRSAHRHRHLKHRDGPRSPTDTLVAGSSVDFDKKVEEEVARRVEEEVKKRVEQIVASDQFKVEIEMRLKAERALLESRMRANMESEKKKILAAFKQEEIEKQLRTQQLEEILAENERRVREEQRRLAEEQARRDEERLRELERLHQQKEEMRKKRMQQMVSGNSSAGRTPHSARNASTMKDVPVNRPQDKVAFRIGKPFVL